MGFLNVVLEASSGEPCFAGDFKLWGTLSAKAALGDDGAANVLDDFYDHAVQTDSIAHIAEFKVAPYGYQS